MNPETSVDGCDWLSGISDAVRARLGDGEPRLWYSLERLGEWLATLDDDKVLAVVDRYVTERSTVAPMVQRWLSARNVVVFDQIAPNPSLESVVEAADLARKSGADHVLAIGGGSTIDSAKLAALGARDRLWSDRVRNHVPVDDLKPLPLVAVPTTSGSGSEATPFAVVYRGSTKLSVAHPQLRPQTVVLDVRLAMEMPPPLAAVTGLDALSQALESFWAVGSTELSRSDARMALDMVAESLELSVLSADNERRATMMIAAHLAGRAIAVGKTTAAHAISYTLTKRWNVPHGLAVALTLGHVAAWNAQVTEGDCMDPRGVDHVRCQVERGAQVLQAAPSSLPSVVQQLLRRLGLPATLAEVGVAESDLAAITSSVDPVRLGNNPRRFTIESMNQMLFRAWR